MADVQIARDVMAEAGVHLVGSWTDKYIKQMAVGVATFGVRLAQSGGLARLAQLLGGNVRVRDWSCGGAGCAPPANIWFAWELWFPSGYALNDIAGLFVHELAHVMDWQSHYSFSTNWSVPPLTNYARDPKQYPERWDVSAEAVAVWVMGDFNVTGSTFTTTYKWAEVSSINMGALTVQMHRMTNVLNGW